MTAVLLGSCTKSDTVDSGTESRMVDHGTEWGSVDSGTEWGTVYTNTVSGADSYVQQVVYMKSVQLVGF